MLTREHAIVAYERGWAWPGRLTTHTQYVDHARRMRLAYRHGIGKTRRELHRSVEGILAAESDCETRRIAAFCKLLDDASQFDADRGGKAAKLRLKVFDLAAPSHPLVGRRDQLSRTPRRRSRPASPSGWAGRGTGPSPRSMPT